MDEKKNEKFRQMTEDPIGPLILRLSAPCIVSMLVTTFYNMADTFFVGMLKDNAATGAVGVVFSLMSIIQAIGFFFGQGSGSFISRELGKQNYEEAANMAATGFFSSLLTGAAICAVGQVFATPLASLLGSTPTILPHALAYMRVILLGAPWVAASMVLNNQLRFQGNASYAMIGITSGSVLNIVLDPLLIFTFRLGVAGAAWATIISQFVSFVLLLICTARSGGLRIQISRFQLNPYYYYMIYKGGLPSLARQSLASFATIALNNSARPYGDAAIAAMSVVQRITMFGGSTMIGFGQGFQPVCGFNYGAKRYDRVKQGFYFSVRASTIFLIAVSALGICFAPQLIALFRDDPEVIACGSLALRFQCITYFTMGWIVMSNMMQQTVGLTGPATFLSIARQGLFFIPVVLILSRTSGLLGIQLSQSVADLLTLACAVPMQLKILRKMGSSPEK